MVFLSADRMNHLRCLKKIPERFGILCPVTVSNRFLFFLSSLPHTKILDSGGFKFTDYMNRQRYLKIADVFGFDYVFSQDSLHNSLKSLENFRKLKEIHKIIGCSAVLVPVLQGQTPDDYLNAYYDYEDCDIIAIGGLLRKFRHKRNSIVDDDLLFQILDKLKFSKKKLFVLGAYSKSREWKFIRKGIWGCDTTGWQLQYPYKKMKLSEKERNEHIIRYILSIDSDTLRYPNK